MNNKAFWGFLVVLAFCALLSPAQPAAASVGVVTEKDVTVIAPADCSAFSAFNGVVQANTPLIVGGNFLDKSNIIPAGTAVRVVACGNGYPYGYAAGLYAVVYKVKLPDGQEGLVFADQVK